MPECCIHRGREGKRPRLAGQDYRAGPQSGIPSGILAGMVPIASRDRSWQWRVPYRQFRRKRWKTTVSSPMQRWRLGEANNASLIPSRNSTKVACCGRCYAFGVLSQRLNSGESAVSFGSCPAEAAAYSDRTRNAFGVGTGDEVDPTVVAPAALYLTARLKWIDLGQWRGHRRRQHGAQNYPHPLHRWTKPGS